MADQGVDTTQDEADRRAALIEEFAAQLRTLREAAGSPSFRDMAARSRAISHTTLHEAACGSRLPSWATTVEFVKACDAEPDAFREQWEKANRVVRAHAAARSARTPSPRTPGPRTPGPQPPSPRTEGAVVPAAVPAATGRLRRHRRLLLAGAVATTVLVGSGAAWLSLDDETPEHQLAALEIPHEPTAADCPVQQQDPPKQPTAHPGDEVIFVGDITLPDCTHIKRSSKVTKDWRFKNAGTVPWVGYALRRVDLPQRPDQCQTFNEIPIAATKPGEFVDVEVEVTAPPQATFCFVRFKMVDGAGRVAFASHRPVNFQVIVD